MLCFSLSWQLHFTAVCPGEVGQGILPGCYMVTTTSGTERDQRTFFHTTTKPLSQPPEAAGAFTQPRRPPALPHQWQTAGRQKRLGRRWKRRQRKNIKAKQVGGTLAKKPLVPAAAGPHVTPQTRLTFVRASKPPSVGKAKPLGAAVF